MYLRGPTVQCSPFGLRASCLSCLPSVSTESVLAAVAAAARGMDGGKQAFGPRIRIKEQDLCFALGLSGIQEREPGPCLGAAGFLAQESA
jgi:hypothetical protein